MAHWIYERGVADIAEMTNLAKAAREKLQEHYQMGRMAPATSQTSVDGTKKYLFPTVSGHYVESVFIPDGDRGTLCVSSQAGCRMGCRFCMTGRQGFGGNLSATDILNQIYSLPERNQQDLLSLHGFDIIRKIVQDVVVHMQHQITKYSGNQ